MSHEYIAIYTQNLTEEDKARIETLCTPEPQTQQCHPDFLSCLTNIYDRIDRGPFFAKSYWFTDPNTIAYLKLYEPTPHYIGYWDMDDLSAFSELSRLSERHDMLCEAADTLQERMEEHRNNLIAILGPGSPQIPPNIEYGVFEHLFDPGQAINQRIEKEFIARAI